jgi:hypothetical protein
MNQTNSSETLTDLLDSIQCKLEAANSDDDNTITIGEILEMVGRRSYGPLLLIIGLLSVSPATLIPGSTWAFAALTLLIAVQMVFGLKHPWLPKKALDFSLQEKPVMDGIGKARRWTMRIDKLIRPRWTFLAKAPWVSVFALICVAAALITFPLGFIPFAPLLPGLSIILVGLGLTARDGFLLSAAGIIVLIAGCFIAGWRPF